jgi:nucleolin
MNAKLFIANLSWSVREEDLTDLFAEMGSVMSVKIPTRREDGKPRGFAFVEMATPEDGQKVLERFNGFSLAGRDLVVSFQDDSKASGGGSGGGYSGGASAEVEKTTKLFVRNLNRSITDTELQALFQQAGTVLSVKVVMDRETGESRGFAFVEMGSVEDASEAIQQLNGRMVQNREIIVNFQDPSRVKAKPPRQDYSRSGGGYGGSGSRGGYSDSDNYTGSYGNGGGRDRW